MCNLIIEVNAYLMSEVKLYQILKKISKCNNMLGKRIEVNQTGYLPQKGLFRLKVKIERYGGDRTSAASSFHFCVLLPARIICFERPQKKDYQARIVNK